ncbi:MAG: Hsp20/alpha crystallin family protein [Gammaproteobacteria bacterium]|nr:Hsp20/alpha crystallin family protein [Gammaproteobacteria bacterium]
MHTKKDLSKSSNNEQHNYLSAFRNLEHKLENMFSHLWHSPASREEKDELAVPMTFSHFPKMDVIDREKEIFIKAELPGIDKNDIDISITNNRLLIKGRSHSENKEEYGDYLKQEIRSSEIYRSFNLPGEIDDENIKTSFNNGVLELVIPKQKSSYRRRIKVE